MRKWEYGSVPLESDNTENLDNFDVLGDLGYELVGINKYYAYFKRPIEPEIAAETLTASISSSFDNFEEVVEKGIKFIERLSKVAHLFIPEE